ncbi:arsenate reductase/protein-tyrosine-phosphatase family protein [Mucisphaera calidilacus]|uniref:arsenate reductase/protein-tyrosine-phosphatase family protein n=1 Tax=Mucisphaera calidilacus TaxID=2527982 RepID=UPI0021BC6B96|nr:hypothetical protein [Mucisphaera calidilacus]
MLFLCTGNYYRSRFSEQWFNHLSSERGLAVRANSRALGLDEDPYFSYPTIAVRTLEKLESLGLEPDPARLPLQVVEEELASAALVVAIKEAEHRQRLAAKFPGWEERVRYWHVHDLDGATPEEALGELEVLVGELVDEMADGSA